jgi:hypothetical protein
MITVADRFNFSSSELFNMKTSRLKYWYEAVKELIEKENPDRGK